MFWYFILRKPSSYCIPHTIIECRMTILTTYFSCLAARGFLREDCLICPLAPLLALFRYLQRECYCAVAATDEFCGQTCSCIRSRHCAAALFLQIPEKCERPGSQFHLHFDIWNIQQIRMEKSKASAQRLLPAAMLEHWLHVSHKKITFEILPKNWMFPQNRIR